MTLLPTKSHFLSSPWIHKERYEFPVDANCYFCISSSVMYRCEVCKVYVCEDCCLLPCEDPSHWFHPHHPLRMNVVHEAGKGVCDGCHYLLWCHVYYKCNTCVFRLCVECFRSSRTNRRPLLGWENGEKLSHYSHVHGLTRCRFREDIEDCKCVMCEDPMWGVGYACLTCNHFVHESCLDTPRIISEHPLHSYHTLKRQDYNISHKNRYPCQCCKRDFNDQDYPFGCEECTFHLHWQCAKLQAIKLDHHEHSLRHLTKYYRSLLCQVCNESTGESILRCVQCSVGFHLKCIDLPPKHKHVAHHHTLTLMNTSHIYTSKEYYCGICEATRDPSAPSYHCQECNFFAHIECALFEEECVPQFSLTNEVAEIHPTHLESSDKEIINHLIHDHPLSLRDGFYRLCDVCRIQLDGVAYLCNKCWFTVHKRCTTLQEKLDYPLHNHTLSFIKMSRYRICCLCRALDVEGSSFACRTCDFVIDIRCAFLKDAEEISFDNKGNPYTLSHVFHQHELSLAIPQTGVRFEESLFICKICGNFCVGCLAYSCVKGCGYVFHAECLQWPSMIESHLLHPAHTLKLTGTSERDPERYTESLCFACGGYMQVKGERYIYQRMIGSYMRQYISGWYECEMYGSATDMKCQVVFHVQCGSSLGRLMKYKHHSHSLYYIHKRPRTSGTGNCRLCGIEVQNSFYRCVECKYNAHLRCLRLPHTAKHKLHLHPLTFKDSTDHGGYYCDVCEELRDFEYPVYCCEDCDFVTHLECIVSEENACNVTFEEIEDGSK